MENCKIAMVGDRDTALAFKVVGADVFAAATPFELRDVLKKLAQEGYGVIFVTESLAESAPEIIDRYRAGVYPIVLPIPDSRGATGHALENLSKNVERAVGSDILFKNKKQ
ncbi:MAG: V-type ATP synthase subunit F [Clostridiales bacterium]|jgi:V/A-type H+-transporting ATPase subunit F|nr:V-type ATP synthase subunit F [Clostridiales bacterium]